MALRAEISDLKIERDKLLEHILNPPKEVAPPVIPTEEFKPILPAHVPWYVRRKMLEEQDRAKARAMKDAAQSDKPLTVEEIENELLKVEQNGN